jgi:XTP/dITP diphosphohydrolase
MFDLILGTGNAKKIVELKLLLPADRVSLTSLADIPGAIDVDETGTTFTENARLKATEQAKHLGRWVLAEDSGLCVDALGGAPGVISARYAGKHGDNEANNDKLLAELAKVPDDRRDASFHCHICLSDPLGNAVIETEGICRGRIARQRTGNAGFGYDPLFVIREYHRSFAELNLAVKQAISHRSIALRQFIPKLLRIVREHENR